MLCATGFASDLEAINLFKAALVRETVEPLEAAKASILLGMTLCLGPQTETTTASRIKDQLLECTDIRTGTPARGACLQHFRNSCTGCPGWNAVTPLDAMVQSVPGSLPVLMENQNAAELEAASTVRRVWSTSSN